MVLFFGFRCSKQSVSAMIFSLVGAALLSSGTLTFCKAYVGILLGIGCGIGIVVVLIAAVLITHSKQNKTEQTEEIL